MRLGWSREGGCMNEVVMLTRVGRGRKGVGAVEDGRGREGREGRKTPGVESWC